MHNFIPDLDGNCGEDDDGPDIDLLRDWGRHEEVRKKMRKLLEKGGKKIES